MRTPSLILKEVMHRKLNFLLSLSGMAAAVTLFVFFYTAGEASRLETARITRNIGLNLRIIPKQTNMDQFWVSGFSDHTMPEDYVHQLASHSGLNYAHLLPTLKQKIQWRGAEVILEGRLPEISPVDKKKPSMSIEPQQGTIYIGYELAHQHGLKKGDQVELSGRTFEIARILKETCTQQDVTLIGHLHDVQEILGLKEQLNEIQALNCVCFDTNQDALEMLREQLTPVLPEAKVLQIRPIADARQKQRQMVEDYLAMILPFAMVICAAWIGLLAMINVRERRQEIGILRALGYGSGKIAELFLGKASVIGVFGAVIGFGLGTWLAFIYGPEVFKLTWQKIEPLYFLLGWSILVAPAFAALASFMPAMIAVTQDPAETLREE